jgi:hypothetical protein
VDDQIDDEHGGRSQMPSLQWLWEGKEQRLSPVPVEHPGNHDIDRDEGEDRIRCQETQFALDPWAMAQDLRHHPSDPMATLCQVDDDQAGENQSYVSMDGVSDVEELQGPKCRCHRDQEP